jgi:hypothetical protein
MDSTQKRSAECLGKREGGASPATRRYLEAAGLIGLAGLTFFFVATSWRAWPDPLIDFGHQLYVPWRLTQGAVLYRDVDDFYGPLSQYLNAALFACFGRGLMVLVTANLAVFAGIVTGIYLLCRTAWGVGAALAAAATFISVFGFSQYDRGGNYNYATPYAHETTHGLLVCVWLVWVLLRWLDRPTSSRSFLAGLLFGLTAVLKPEIMLAGGLVTITAGAIAWRNKRLPGWKASIFWIAGAILPTLAFAAYFSAFFSWEGALGAASRGWLNALTTTRYSGYSLQQKFLGFDHPWRHFLEQASATSGATVLIAAMAGAAWLADRSSTVWKRLLVVGSLGIALAWLACHEIVWLRTGRCLLGLALIYTTISAASLAGQEYSPMRSARLLIGVLAAALMARMILNGRIDGYGYCQAAVAGLLVPAVLLGELPQRIGARRWGTAAIVIGSIALLLPGIVILARDSQRVLVWKTQLVGDGPDRFYAFPPEVDATGEVVNFVTAALQNAPPGQTLLVLPEGVMINYLAHLPSTVAPYCFYAMATADGREDEIVAELKSKPPDWVVIISRDLRDYGIPRYGDETDNGRQLLRWVKANYEIVEPVGGDPFDSTQCGALILKRKGEN